MATNAQASEPPLATAMGQDGLAASEGKEALMTALLDERPGAPDRSLAALYTLTEAARYLSVPQSTLGAWRMATASSAEGALRSRVGQS